MPLKISTRGQIDPFIVMDVMREANALVAAGEDIVHLEVGQPGTPAPAKVREAATAAIRDERLGYTDALGVPALRERIAAHYDNMYGVDVAPERIVVTTGSSGGFLLAFLAAFDVGDRVALAAPGYPAYRNILSALGVEPVVVETSIEDRFQPTPGVIGDVAGDLDGLIVASPSNPTGTMIGDREMQSLTDLARQKSMRFISDEIYHGITYGHDSVTALAYDDEAIVINSFSKYFSMTGWRLGWLVVPESMMRSVECLAQNFFISAPTLSQYAALAAFDSHDELRENVAKYARNRDILLNDLPGVGFDRLAPADGAFYVYADVSQLTNDSNEFCRRMLTEARIATTPGLDFDPYRGNASVRFSFAGTEDDMRRAIDRLSAWRP
ncbi:MAG: pyridoxal phosphate-dependent aminotransferase [Rhodospirillaceae bacterium]|jgi:aspartate/methionine/tyrosine aminotransferase|nr:pyridoxal phosphate-dependent aminotransferase [Rhodospirillaceae bacterium]MBT5944020.1 pyridoxal phosphate-dependent aminotransferase [Rhodospirillaceae bacterium]MBT6404173.1 pyridoxal phosphate-dependent aminotransferase [Rhodospirillaceae bacterium]MBT6536380.1 pyridoxal phosphate-dependent aminotransferase [Rhodospirillaceae bacterium]MBT7360716.1 pyridoxal phosphate-dependent aminotransferase [Rhodospirillaceae bacterium]